MKFDQSAYWVERHKMFQGDPRSVGNMAASREDNERGESELKQIIARLAERTSAASVLDLGCGYGRAAEPFLARGIKYFGIDVSPMAVADARGRHPSGQFWVADLNLWEPDRGYDMVCLLYVLVHFVDEQDWLRFTTNAVNAVAPFGELIIADHFPSERQTPAPHVVSRPFAEYMTLLGKLGLQWDESFTRALERQFPRSSHAHQFRRFIR